VKCNPIEQRRVSNRSGVSGPLSERLSVGLPGPSNVYVGNCREWHRFDAVDFDLDAPHVVAAADPRVGPTPKPEGQGDVTRGDVVVKLPTELHGWST
jgi:hypothetical protein